MALVTRVAIGDEFVCETGAIVTGKIFSAARQLEF